jgi:hypothetical protein
VRNDVVVGVEGVCARAAVSSRSGPSGIVAVDGSTGRVLAYLPLGRMKATNALLLGWDGDRPIIGVPLPGQKDSLAAFAGLAQGRC